MELLSPVGLLVYSISLASVVALSVALLRQARKNNAIPSPRRLLSLSEDETRRVTTGDPVSLMHLSITLGVGLSILIAILGPLLLLVAPLRDFFLIVSAPLVVGLAAAFAWRLQRYVGSKRVEKGIVHTDQRFSRASTIMQLVLMVAIALTTAELLLAWFSSLSVVDTLLDAVRNTLLLFYYVNPSVNLIKSFDRPLSAMQTPFKLSDVMEGKVDASQITIGATKLSEFSDFERFSYHSCVEIGACESACPATAAGRPLSPRIVVRKLALLEGDQGQNADPLSTVTEEELWSCTSCGACVQSCPVAVKHVDVIYEMRRNLVSVGKLDREKSVLLQNLTQSQNPYGFDSVSRGDWAKDNGVETLSTDPSAEYLYWVGCVSSFDQRAQNVARALSKVLKSAGVSFAILGSEELCTGDPARRLGEEGRYQELALRNIERMNSYKVRKVITSCPHCFNAIKNEYPQFGGVYEVMHHTQVISDLIKQGRLKVSAERLKQVSVTLHDACYAARYNDILDEPRDILDASGIEVREMHRRKTKTFCCGAGGSNYWYKVQQQRSIAGIRTEEAIATGATTIATECPFCLSMFEDSTKASGAKMTARDVVEILAEGLASPDTERLQ